MSYVHDAALLYHILRIYVALPPNSYKERLPPRTPLKHGTESWRVLQNAIQVRSRCFKWWCEENHHWRCDATSSHHRTPTFDLHAVRSRLHKSCPEMDSGREFRVGISPTTKWHRLEEVMCTWITCTWRLNLLLHILQVPCVKGFISRSFYSLVRAAFYSSRRPSRMRRPHIIVMYSGAAVNKETIKPKYWQRHARVRERYPLSPWV